MDTQETITVLARHNTHRTDRVLWRWICEECGELHSQKHRVGDPYPDLMFCSDCGAMWRREPEWYAKGAIYAYFGLTRLNILMAG